jgi:hypothetical protein
LMFSEACVVTWTVRCDAILKKKIAIVK